MEAKRPDSELQQSARRFHALVANAPLCILEIDLEGRVVSMNPAGLRMLGLNDVCEISGKQLADCVSARDRVRVQRLLAAASSGATVELEFAAPSATGTRLFEQRLAPLLTDDGQVEGLVGITHDVTERRAHEEELRAAHEFREELFQTAQVVVLVLDGNGTIVDFNPFLERLSGIRLEDARGQDWFTTFLPERDRERVRRVFHRALEGTKTRGNVNPIVTADGRELEIEWYSSLLTQPGGSVGSVIAIGHDVTEQKRSERELFQSESKLRQLSGMLLTAQEEERRHLSRELHDDLGQRLTLLKMEIDQLRSTRREPTDGGDIGPRLDAAAEIIEELTEQVSDMSRRVHPSIVEHLGLEAALTRLCDGVSKASAKTVVIDVGEGVGRQPPSSAAMCLYRVAQEALRNAIKHSESDRIEVTLESVGGGIRLSVEDWGRGFSMKGERSDGGLGLVSMQERSRLVDGQLDVRSSPGQGTRVRCWVPLPNGAGPASE